jgi:hypothetical protein
MGKLFLLATNPAFDNASTGSPAGKRAIAVQRPHPMS